MKQGNGITIFKVSTFSKSVEWLWQIKYMKIPNIYGPEVSSDVTRHFWLKCKYLQVANVTSW